MPTRPNRSNNNPRFVDLARYSFLIEPRYYFYGWSSSPRLHARKSAADALLRARAFLPPSYNFKVWDAQRTRAVQTAMLDSFEKRLRLMHPDIPRKSALQLLYKFGGRPNEIIKRPGTHRNGGSFDVTIVNEKGVELYMGTDHDDLTPKAALDYFEKRRSLTSLEKHARKNRRLLERVMTKAGFTAYTPEWWHWSYES
jgi:D-alanyl-D-alanine dipeptidase